MKKSDKISNEYGKVIEKLAAATEERDLCAARAKRLQTLDDPDAATEQKRADRMAALCEKLSADEKELGQALTRQLHIEALDQARALVSAIEGPAQKGIEEVDALTATISTAFDRLAQLAGQLPPDALRRGINSCNTVSLAENVLLQTSDRIHEGQSARLLREINELRVVFSLASAAARKELAALEAAQG